MALTAGMIKELREITGVGMMECKNVLTETDGNIEKAIELLRERGLSAAAKKAGRIATEGLVSANILENGNIGVIVEVNSETDFVAKNAEFIKYVDQVTSQIGQSSANSVEDLLNEKWAHDNAITVGEALSQKIAIIGENLTIRRFDKFTKNNDSTFVSYIHGGGRVAVLLEMETTSTSELVQEAGKNICMQIAAMSPRFVSREDISADFIEKETEILTQQALNEGKPADVVEKMIVGRLNKQLKEMCLVDQEYVKAEDKETINGYLDKVSKEIGSSVKVSKFVRFETGEGLEKKEENFADEVNKVIQG